MRIEVGKKFKNAFVLEKLKSCPEYGNARYKVICQCGKTFIGISRNMRRNKYNQCGDCKREMNKSLCNKAVLKRKPWREPDFRKCKGCLLIKNYSEFPPKRHTCKKCSNIGRLAYYYNKTEIKQ